MSQFAKRTGQNPVADPFVSDRGDIKDLESALAGGGEQILAAMLQAAHIIADRFTIALGQGQCVLSMALKPVRVSLLVEVGSNNGLGFLPFRDFDGLDGSLSTAVDEQSHEVDIVTAVTQRLG